MSITYVSSTELRHTYPYGSHDAQVDFNGGEDLRARVDAVFAADAECRRVVVMVEQENVEQIKVCEDAGLRYVLDVQLRTGEEVSLMVSEPDWVTAQSTDVKDLELK